MTYPPESDNKVDIHFVLGVVVLSLAILFGLLSASALVMLCATLWPIQTMVILPGMLITTLVFFWLRGK